jgi:hypothetical protein
LGCADLMLSDTIVRAAVRPVYKLMLLISFPFGYGLGFCGISNKHLSLRLKCSDLMNLILNGRVTIVELRLIFCVLKRLSDRCWTVGLSKHADVRIYIQTCPPFHALRTQNISAKILNACRIDPNVYSCFEASDSCEREVDTFS